MDIEQVGNKIKSERLAEENFSDVYSADEIAADISENKKFEEDLYEREASLRPDDKIRKKLRDDTASKLEEALSRHAILWFGEDLKVTRAAKSDDYLRGVDLYAELPNQKTDSIVLAIDVTKSFVPQDIHNKVFRGLHKMFGTNESERPEIKYFRSKIDGRAGLMTAIPVVILLDDITTTDIINSNGKPRTNKVRDLIAKEIEMQLNLYKIWLKDKKEPAQKELMKQVVILEKYFSKILREQAKSVSYLYDPAFKLMLDTVVEALRGKKM